MKRRFGRPAFKGGLDPVGPFHPYVAYAAVLLFDLAIMILGVAILLWIGDLAEDRIWPGGNEWIDF